MWSDQLTYVHPGDPCGQGPPRTASHRVPNNTRNHAHATAGMRCPERVRSLHSSRGLSSTTGHKATAAGQRPGVKPPHLRGCLTSRNSLAPVQLSLCCTRQLQLLLFQALDLQGASNQTRCYVSRMKQTPKAIHASKQHHDS